MNSCTAVQWAVDLWIKFPHCDMRFKIPSLSFHISPKGRDPCFSPFVSHFFFLPAFVLALPMLLAVPKLNPPPLAAPVEPAPARNASAAALESGDVALPSAALTVSESGTNCPAKNLVHVKNKENSRGAGIKVRASCEVQETYESA
jgi:hypothetical protein